MTCTETHHQHQMKTRRRTMLLSYRSWRLLIGCALLLCGLSDCHWQPFVSREAREKQANTAQGDIVIGVVNSSNVSGFFLQGVMLAVEELNQHGGVLSRKLNILVEDDKGELDEGRRIAEKFASNPDVVAVIGHIQDQVAIPASVVYEAQGILLLSPGALDPTFTLFGENFTFRNIPNGIEMGRQLAKFVYDNKWKKVVVCYLRQETDTYRRLIDSFKAEAGAAGRGIEIATTKSFFEQQTNFQSMLTDINKSAPFDALVIAGEVPSAAYLIKQARGMGIQSPIVATSGLDSVDFWTIAGRAAEGTIVATIFDPLQPTPLTREFVKNFKAKYGVEPDMWSAQGYDAVQVLTNAMEKSDSTVPIVLSNTLRFMEPWKGVTGNYQFTTQGDITNKAIFFKQAQNGSFTFLSQQAETDMPVDSEYVAEEITLRLPLPQEPATLDPALAAARQDVDVIQQLFVSLTTINPATYEAMPSLAEQWTVSDDGKVYQFQLRRDAVWTDGKPVTAQDVVWAIRRNVDPGLKAPSAYMLSALKNVDAFRNGKMTDPEALGVRAIDDYTVEFTLETPAPYFPTMVSYPVFQPLPRHVIDAHPTDWTDPKYLQTNGPYTIALWEKGNVLILRRNPQFFDAEHVAIPEIRYYLLPRQDIAFAMYLDQRLDMLGGPYTAFPLDKIATIKADPALREQYHPQPNLCTVMYGMNTKRPPTDNVLVRKALAAVIDRRLLIELSTQGGEMPAASVTVPTLFSGDAPNAAIPFDPIQAQQWLEQAGYPDGQGLPEISISYPTDNPDAYSTTAHPLQTFMSYYLHAPIKLGGLTPDEYRKQQEQPNTANLFRLSWCADYPDPNSFLNDMFNPTNPSNLIGWNNQEFVSLMDNAMHTADQKQRQEMYRRAEDILCKEEAAIIPLYYDVAHMLVNPRVKDWSYMPVNGQRIIDWSLEK